MQASVPVALWQHTADPADRARLDRLRAASGYDWARVQAFRDKEEAGHEEPWYSFLRGDNPEYPGLILAAAHAQARRRLALMEAHACDEVTEDDIHLWQNLNPVVTEALTQLTLGRPAGAVQRRAGAGPGALLRRGAAQAGASGGCFGAGQQHRSRGDRGDAGQLVRDRCAGRGGAGGGVRSARHRGGVMTTGGRRLDRA